MKNYLIQNYGYSEKDFENYNSLKISPIRVDMSKREQKHAIFTLGKEIAEIIETEQIKQKSPANAKILLRDEYIASLA